MIQVQNLSVYFAGQYLFQSISFRLNFGDRIGLAGKNGAGKSTLLKILAKDQQPTEGHVDFEGEISIGYLSQDIDFDTGKTVFQEVEKAFKALVEIEKKIEEINHDLAVRTDYESEEYGKLIEDISTYTEKFSLMGGYTKEAEMEKILLGLGFKKEDFSRNTDEFSGGWRMRIELAKLLLQNHDALLLDEPTNHLDIDSIIWFEDFLKTYKGSIILVSHDKIFLDNVTTRTIEIANRKIEDYKANYSRFLQLRRERKEKLAQTQKNQEKEIKRTQDLINKFRAKASKAAMAQSLIKKLDKIDIIEVEEEDVSKMNIRFQISSQPGKVIYEINALEKSYGTKKILDKVNLYVNRGDKIAFVGQNGQGKSTLAKILVDQLKYEKGEIILGHNVQVGYFAQDQSKVLTPDFTVLQEAEHAANEDTSKNVRSLLGAFLFSGDKAEKKVKVLSGGERNRLALCKLLLQPFNVLVMDEPTNHLDIQSKEILKFALRQFEGTLILVSHDREFLEDLADKVYEFKEGKVVEFLGGINDYLAEKKVSNFREFENKTSKEIKVEKPKQAIKPEEPNKEDKKTNNKIAKTEEEIAHLEQQIKEIEDSFLEKNPTLEQLKAYEELKKELANKVTEWEKLLSS
ncbi:MAG: ABC-F family ATP-binding cassette domain-containing protein [Solirubrobacteraceae bacterium]